MVGACRWRTFGVGHFSSQQLLMVIGLLLVIFARPASATGPRATKNILVIFSFPDRSVEESVDLLKPALRASIPYELNFQIEYFESRRFPSQRYEQTLVATLQDTLGQKPDLVIVSSTPALQFALRHRNELFPDVPILFFWIDAERLAGQLPGPMWPGVTGVTISVRVRDTMELALRLHPHTKNVAIIAGGSEWEDYWRGREHAELARNFGQLKVIDLVALSPDQLLERVAALPPQTIVLFQIAPAGSIQPAVGAHDVLASVARRLPTYCAFPEICLNHGGIGGAAYDTDQEYRLVAEQARRLLSGERPEDIPVLHDTSQRILVDWRQLRYSNT